MAAEKLLKPEQAAKQLNCSRDTLNRMRTENRIPEGEGFVQLLPKVFRYKQSWINNFIEGKVKAQPYFVCTT